MKIFLQMIKIKTTNKITKLGNNKTNILKINNICNNSSSNNNSNNSSNNNNNSSSKNNKDPDFN